MELVCPQADAGHQKRTDDRCGEMARTPLTMDAALQLLDGYEEEMAGELAIAVDDETAALRLVQDPSSKDAESRFKRARDRKKSELAFYRTQASGLERVLRLLQQQRRRIQPSTKAGAWQLTAMRQIRERREAELLNAQLKAMVNTTLQQTRLLQSLFAYPNELKQLVPHKCERASNVVRLVSDLLELNSLVVAADLCEASVDATLERLRDDDGTVKSFRGDQGCGLVWEAVDSRVLPYEVASVSRSVWWLLAASDEQLSSNDLTFSRIHPMSITSGTFSASYKGTSLYRKRTDNASGRVVITWTTSYTISGSQPELDSTHESFRREEFVVISPTSINSPTCSLQTFAREEREACGLGSCCQGAWGNETLEETEAGAKVCIASEMKTFLHSVEQELETYEAVVEIAG